MSITTRSAGVLFCSDSFMRGIMSAMRQRASWWRWLVTTAESSRMVAMLLERRVFKLKIEN